MNKLSNNKRPIACSSTLQASIPLRTQIHSGFKAECAFRAIIFHTLLNFVFFLVLASPLLSFSQTVDTTQLVHYIPEAFNNIETGIHHTEATPCHPKHPDPKSLRWRGIVVNAPKEIHIPIANLTNSAIVKIPFCSYGEFPGLKINEANYCKITLYNIENELEVDMLIDFRRERNKHRDPQEYPNPADKPLSEKRLKESKNLVCPVFRSLDIFEYLKMPIKAGKYKFWAESAGYRSNEVVFEIVIDK